MAAQAAFAMRIVNLGSCARIVGPSVVAAVRVSCLGGFCCKRYVLLICEVLYSIAAIYGCSHSML
jgi:hypothetical protein